MVTDFEDFCLCVYVVVDDLCRERAGALRRSGPEPECSDSELLSMLLIGECRGWDVETELLSHLAGYRHLFPRQPSQSRLNRRRRQLQSVLELIRQALLDRLDLAQDRQAAIDSVPVPVVGFHRAPLAIHHDWAAHGAAFGQVPSKKETIYGYKLHLLVSLSGVIRNFTLAPANATDLSVGAEMLAGESDLTVVGDKAYISAPVAAELWETNRVCLLTKPRKNQRRQIPDWLRRTINASRQIIETVADQLVEQFHLQTNHAHTFWGLCARLQAKLTAHTLCLYLNRLLGNPYPLQIKRLAFN